jgi:peptidoglycan hydrolase-like protein with peptidoglycan-binding domain
MEYGSYGARAACENCGEPAEGRYCRMCGTPVGGSPVTGAPGDGQAMEPSTRALSVQLPGYGGGAYEGHSATQAPGESTQAMAAVPAGYAGYEPTRLLAPMPTPPTQPPVEFDSLFRSEDGTPGLHGQTQLLPPVVATDYRMAPPGGAQRPPGAGHGGSGGDEPRTNRPVVIATVGAVLVAAGVIIGLLYLGNQNTSATASGSSVATAKPANAAGSQAPGVIQLPSEAATVAPSTAAPSTAASSAAASAGSAAFSGDGLPLGPGSSGSWVRWVQQRLQQLGYYHGSISGDYDQATALAVQRFQGSAGVTGDPAGTVGQHTQVALAAAGSTPNLRLGSRSSQVARLDEALDLAQGGNLSGDRYSMQTAAAVAQYQQSVGLRATGQVDAATWAKLQTGTLAG